MKLKTPFARLRASLRKPLFVIGFLMLLTVVLAALFAPQIALHGYADMDLANKLKAPGPGFPLGTDRYGRCIFSRIIYGSRIALRVGLIAVVIETGIGVTLGILAGYYGKQLDSVIMSVGYVPVRGAAEALEVEGYPAERIHVIGDAREVGNLMSVIREAYELCYEL